ncbi:MAG: LysM peptidoglycan-binding domain-containing protein, partial [Bdellovibrionales bacterium]|nr:LysM peptidoglycan-binding domain-containing protein [Bdellovibrionales bacterium]
MGILEGIRQYRIYSLVLGTVVLQALLFSVASVSTSHFPSNPVSLSITSTSFNPQRSRSIPVQETDEVQVVTTASELTEIPTNEIESGEVAGPSEESEVLLVDTPSMLAHNESNAELELMETERSDEVVYTVRSGDTLTSIWTNNGGTYLKALQAAKSFEQAGVKLSSIRSGEQIKIQHNGSEISFFEKNLPQGKRLTLRLTPEGTYSFDLFTPTIQSLKRTATGAISSS